VLLATNDLVWGKKAHIGHGTMPNDNALQMPNVVRNLGFMVFCSSGRAIGICVVLHIAKVGSCNV
jgi:hypothetical protein